MASHTSSTNPDLPLVEAAQMGNLEAIASLLQQTITVSQPDFLPDPVVQTVMQTVEQTAMFPGRSSCQVSTDGYDSHWTNQGIVVNLAQKAEPISLTGSLRPTLDPAYRCVPLTRLLGRQQIVNQAIATLQANGAVAISGSDGTGKTALLRALCHHPQITSALPQGILYLRGYDRPLDDLWQSIFDGVGQIHSTQAVVANTVYKPSTTTIQAWLTRQSVGVILDELTGDSHQTTALTQWSQLATRVPLLMAISTPPAAQGTGLDSRFTGVQLPLQGFPLEEAIVLLEEGLGRSLHASERSEAQALCQHVAGHPRRLIQAAALIQQQYCTLAELMQTLRLGATVDTILLKTIGTLPDAERRIVAILATLGGIPLHPNHLPTLMNLSREAVAVEAPLETLEQTGVVIFEGQYCRLADNLVHPIQRSWNLEPWTNQIIHYFTAWLAQLSPPAPAMVEAVMPILANQDTLWSVLQLAVQQQQWAAVLDMGTAMTPGLWLGKQWGRWQQVLLLQWFAARSLQDPAAEATILHQLGSRALCLGDSVAAHTYLTQAFHYRRQMGDTNGAALTQQNLMTLRHQHSPTPPLPHSPTPPLSHSPSTEEQEPSPPPNGGPPPDNAVTLTSPSWFSWSRVAMVVGAIAVLGMGFFLMRRQSFEYGLRRQYTFPPQRTQISSEPYFFTITNTTPEPLPISLAFNQGNEADFSLIGNDCIREPLAPDAQCKLVATFTPQNDGPRLATFAVNIGQEEEPKLVTLRGLGANIEAELRPNAMTFGQQVVAGQSQSQTITFRNHGSVAFMVSETALQDNADNGFKLEKDHCLQQVLQPRDSCNLTFAFTPKDPTTYQSTLNLVDDTGTEVWSVALTGTGIPLPDPVTVSVPVPVPVRTPPRRVSASSPSPSPSPTPSPTAASSANLEIQPTAIAFEHQPLNATAIRTVTVENTHNQPVKMNETILSNSRAFSLNRDTCSNVTLFPGDRCDINLLFQADRAGQYDAALIIGNGSNGRLHRVAITATSVASTESSSGGESTGDDEMGTNETSTNETGSVGSEPTEANSVESGPTEPSPIEEPRPINAEPTPEEPGSAISPRNPDAVVAPSSEIQAPEIQTFTANPATGLQPTDRTELCYAIAHATQAYIVNETTGERIELPTPSHGCVTPTPGRSTTYTLVAINQANQEVRRALDVEVAGLDQEAPPVPQAIAPSDGDTVFCDSTTSLAWSAATDNNGPVTYRVTLQRREVPAATEDDTATLVSATWVNLPSPTTREPRLDLSGLVAPPFTYRWRVQAVDAAGNVSTPSPWSQFWCISP
ncbi:MAG: choice-of-anchor D domain-containing protein [Leptolyngbyaceae cyanobacterium]